MIRKESFEPASLTKLEESFDQGIDELILYSDAIARDRQRLLTNYRRILNIDVESLPRRGQTEHKRKAREYAIQMNNLHDQMTIIENMLRDAYAYRLKDNLKYT